MNTTNQCQGSLQEKAEKLLRLTYEKYLKGELMDGRDHEDKYENPTKLWWNKVTHPDFDDMWIEVNGRDSTKSMSRRAGGFADHGFDNFAKMIGLYQVYKDRYIPEIVRLFRKDGDKIYEFCTSTSYYEYYSQHPLGLDLPRFLFINFKSFMLDTHFNVFHRSFDEKFWSEYISKETKHYF